MSEADYTRIPSALVKACLGCNLEKPLDEFPKAPLAADGRHFRCRACMQQSYQQFHLPEEEADYSRKDLFSRVKNRHYEEPPEGQKWCPHCGDYRPIDDFPTSRSRPDGHLAWCRTHWALYRADRRRRNPNQPGTERRWALAVKYGITEHQYNEMLEGQHGTCAICCGVPKGRKALSVDHDHETGEVRALLCDRCNLGIGAFLENPLLMDTAIAYLKRFGK